VTARPPAGVERRRRWAIRLIVRALVAPSTVTDDERAAVGKWLALVARGGEMRPFDLGSEMRRRGYTRQSFADRLGVTRRLVQYWLSGHRVPSYDMARRIADALGLPAPRVVVRYPTRKTLAQSDPTPYDPTLPLTGRNLAAARRLCKLTQRQLADLAGVRQADLGALESPYRSPPSGTQMEAIQRAIVYRLRRRGLRPLEKPARRRRRQPDAGAGGAGQDPAAAAPD
jgi:transcriptional regulator with XRE-family HTH domain